MQCRLPTRIGELSGGINYVEYIESSGTQYIDTGFKPNNNTRVVMEVIHNSTATEYLFSAATSAPVFGVSYVGGYYSEYGSKSYKFSTASPSETKTTIDLNKNVCTIGGETVTAPIETFSCAGTIYLFCAYGGSYRANYKLYSCKIYDNGTLVRDFRPALDLDGVACLYEKLSKTYYYNKGTGTFAAGASIGGGGSGGSSIQYDVTVSGAGDSNLYITINNTQITSAGEYTIQAGETIYCYGKPAGGTVTTRLILDGTIIKSVDSGEVLEYTFAPAGNCSIDLTYYATGVSLITITTE